MNHKKSNILFLVQYPESISPGQRYRVELYQKMLTDNGYLFTTSPFLNKNGYELIHRKGALFLKVAAVVKGFFRRFLLLLSLHKYDFIFLQREATPVGPPLFEWLYIKVFKKKVIYDFDDAIWIPMISDNNRFASVIKNYGKIKKICQWSYKVSCGNEYLCNFARKYNSNVVYNPTCVDTANHHNLIAEQETERVTIGWTGSFSTLIFLYTIEPVIKRLQLKYDFDIKIICNAPPKMALKNIEYIRWNTENEVTELAKCQIGIMPLRNDDWSEGKCGFKIIQYMALGIPAVSSDVGVNKTVINEGENGFVCATEDEWYNALEKLIIDVHLRKAMGEKGRRKIAEKYSLQSNTGNYLSLFN